MVHNIYKLSLVTKCLQMVSAVKLLIKNDSSILYIIIFFIINYKFQI